MPEMYQNKFASDRSRAMILLDCLLSVFGVGAERCMWYCIICCKL